jgi:hypothetical protein
MHFSEAWKFLEIYKDFITNALDLVSFLLLTKEVLKVIQPELSNLPHNVVSGVAFGALAYIAWIALDTVGDWSKATPLQTLKYILFSFTMIIIMMAIIFFARPGAMRLGTWITRNVVGLGIALFLISRVFAFVVAAHEVLNSLLAA